MSYPCHAPDIKYYISLGTGVKLISRSVPISSSCNSPVIKQSPVSPQSFPCHITIVKISWTIAPIFFTGCPPPRPSQYLQRELTSFTQGCQVGGEKTHPPVKVLHTSLKSEVPQFPRVVGGEKTHPPVNLKNQKYLKYLE